MSALWSLSGESGRRKNESFRWRRPIPDIELSVTERCHRQGGDIADARAGDPNRLINIAHVSRNNVAADIVDIGTVRPVANCSALSQVTMAS
jgi:hypothetical protein